MLGQGCGASLAVGAGELVRVYADVHVRKTAQGQLDSRTGRRGPEERPTGVTGAIEARSTEVERSTKG